MFKKIKEYFKGEETSVLVDKGGRPTERDLHIATAVLLIEMASADQAIAKEEATVVCNTMGAQFGIAEDKLPELVEIAIAARKEAKKIDQFVKAINDSFNDEQRTRILAMIWKVVIADGKVEKFEQRFAKQLQARFKLSDEQAERAGKMAAAGEV